MNTATRTYRTRIDGDSKWVCQVECASGLLATVSYFAPAGEERKALATVAPGTRLVRFQS